MAAVITRGVIALALLVLAFLVYRHWILTRLKTIRAPADLDDPPTDALEIQGVRARVLAPPTEPDLAPPGPRDVVTVHYTGWSRASGKMFDSTLPREQPAAFRLDQVIEGWRIGLGRCAPASAGGCGSRPGSPMAHAPARGCRPGRWSLTSSCSRSGGCPTRKRSEAYQMHTPSRHWYFWKSFSQSSSLMQPWTELFQRRYVITTRSEVWGGSAPLKLTALVTES